MALERLRLIIADEWIKCFKEQFCKIPDMAPYKPEVSTIADLMRIAPDISSDYPHVRKLITLWITVRICDFPEAVVGNLLQEQAGFYEGELVPAPNCYYNHILAATISTVLERVLSENILAPQLQQEVKLGLEKNQQAREAKEPFAYTVDSFRANADGSASGIIYIQYSHDIVGFMQNKVVQAASSAQQKSILSRVKDLVLAPARYLASYLNKEAEQRIAAPTQEREEKAKPQVAAFPQDLPRLSLKPVIQAASRSTPRIQSHMKIAAQYFQAKRTRSSERSFEHAKKRFDQGNHHPDLVQTLIKYSVWKQRKANHQLTSRANEAKSMAAECLKHLSLQP